ncbi:MAG: hypothetical protein ACT4OM_08585 [Actinomycetota bacterium]
MRRASGYFEQMWWPLRVALVALAVLNILCVFTIFSFPHLSGINFAWDIRPVVMGAALGAFYFAASPMVLAAALARTWIAVRVVLLPVAVTMTLTLVATGFHSDRFRAGSGAFNLWIAGYLVVPALLVAAYRRYGAASPAPGEQIVLAIPERLRNFLRINGLSIGGAAGLIFLDPRLLQRASPWTFTPLAARCFAAWLVGYGLVQWSISREVDWERSKIASLFLIVLPSAMALQLWRFRSQVDWGNGFLVVLLAELVLGALVAILLWIATEATVRPQLGTGSARAPAGWEEEQR